MSWKFMIIKPDTRLGFSGIFSVCQFSAQKQSPDSQIILLTWLNYQTDNYRIFSFPHSPGCLGTHFVKQTGLEFTRCFCFPSAGINITWHHIQLGFFPPFYSWCIKTSGIWMHLSSLIYTNGRHVSLSYVKVITFLQFMTVLIW